MSVKNLGLWVRLILRIPTFSQYFASKKGGGVRLIPRKIRYSTWNRDSSKYWVSVPVHVLVFPAYLGVYMGMGAILKQKC